MTEVFVCEMRPCGLQPMKMLHCRLTLQPYSSRLSTTNRPALQIICCNPAGGVALSKKRGRQLLLVTIIFIPLTGKLHALTSSSMRNITKSLWIAQNSRWLVHYLQSLASGAYLCSKWVPSFCEHHVSRGQLSVKDLEFRAKLTWIEDKSVCFDYKEQISG